MSPYLAAVLLLIIAAAVVSMFPLRRYADRQWAEHQRRMVTVRIVVDTSRFVAGMTAMQAAFTTMVPAARKFEAEMQKLGHDLARKVEKP